MISPVSLVRVYAFDKHRVYGCMRTLADCVASCVIGGGEATGNAH